MPAAPRGVRDPRSACEGRASGRAPFPTSLGTLKPPDPLGLRSGPIAIARICASTVPRCLRLSTPGWALRRCPDGVAGVGLPRPARFGIRARGLGPEWRSRAARRCLHREHMPAAPRGAPDPRSACDGRGEGRARFANSLGTLKSHGPVGAPSGPIATARICASTVPRCLRLSTPRWALRRCPDGVAGGHALGRATGRGRRRRTALAAAVSGTSACSVCPPGTRDPCDRDAHPVRPGRVSGPFPFATLLGTLERLGWALGGCPAGVVGRGGLLPPRPAFRSTPHRTVASRRACPAHLVPDGAGTRLPTSRRTGAAFGRPCPAAVRHFGSLHRPSREARPGRSGCAPRATGTRVRAVSVCNAPRFAGALGVGLRRMPRWGGKGVCPAWACLPPEPVAQRGWSRRAGGRAARARGRWPETRKDGRAGPIGRSGARFVVLPCLGARAAAAWSLGSAHLARADGRVARAAGPRGRAGRCPGSRKDGRARPIGLSDARAVPLSRLGARASAAWSLGSAQGRAPPAERRAGARARRGRSGRRAAVAPGPWPGRARSCSFFLVRARHGARALAPPSVRARARGPPPGPARLRAPRLARAGGHQGPRAAGCARGRARPPVGRMSVALGPNLGGALGVRFLGAGTVWPVGLDWRVGAAPDGAELGSAVCGLASKARSLSK